MADFARWVEACGPALGWTPGAFAQACLDLRAELDAQALGLWPVAPVLLRLLARSPVYEGTVSHLLEQLNSYRQDSEARAADWPRTAKAFGSELRRYTPNLRRYGVVVEHPGKGRDGYRVRVAWKPEGQALPRPVASTVQGPCDRPVTVGDRGPPPNGHP
jgi:hypothetical protein